VKLQKVATNDYYEKTINGYFGQSWLETKTYTTTNTMPFLMELLYSTGNITAAAFNETFNYSGTANMAANGWVLNQTAASIPNDTIIPYNKKTAVNIGVVDGIHSDPNEKLLTLNGTEAPQVAYKSAKKFANINYAAWISTPALGDGEAGLLARVVDENNYYQVSYTKDKLLIKKKVAGIFTTIAEKAYTLPATRSDYVFSFNPWGWQETIVGASAHRLRVDLTNDQIDVYVNGRKELSATDSTFEEGYIGIAASGVSAKFDALLVSYTLAVAPTLNEVKVGDERLSLGFTPVDGALRYVVKYGTAPGQYTDTYTTASTSPVIPNLVNDTVYYFVVTAVSATGESVNSNELSGTPKQPDAVTPVLNSLVADGNQVIVNFTTDPTNSSYVIKAGRTSGSYTYTFEGVTDSSHSITLPLTSLPYYVVVVPYNENGFGEPSNEASVVLDTPFLPVTDVTASASPEVLYQPFNTIDGVLTAESRWSAEKEQWIAYDLGSVQEINAVAIAYASGDVRKAFFDIEVSTDGQNWSNVYKDGESSGTTIALETYLFDAVNARYVRILCHGNSASGYGLGWTSIIETRIFAAAPTKPTGLQAESKTANSISLKWNASVNQSGTVISYDVYQGATKLNPSDITGTTCTITDLTPDTNYTLHIVAKDASGKASAPGNALTVRTEAAATPSPTASTGPEPTPTPSTEPTPTTSAGPTPTPSTGPTPTPSTGPTPTPSTGPTPTPSTGPNPTPSPTSTPAAGKVHIKPLKSGEAAAGQVAAAALQQAFDAAAADAAGNKTIVLELEAVDGVKEYRQELPSTFFSADKPAAGQRIHIATPLGSITLSEQMLRASDISEGGRIEISIASVDPSTLDASNGEKIGNGPIVELKVLVDGKPIPWSNNSAPVEVSVDYAPSGIQQDQLEHIVVWYIADNGQVTRVPSGRYDAASGKVTFTTSHFSLYAIVFDKVTFGDLGAVSWAQHAIEVLASKGIINGTSPSTFAPQANITRADFLKLLIGALDLQAEVTDNFEDVSRGDYYYEAVGIAKKLGISNGVGNNKLNPTAPITRQDMMVMVEKALKAAGKGLDGGHADTLDKFKDAAKVAGYAKDSISALVEAGLVAGSGDSLNPQGLTTRAEAAVLLYRIFNY
jgi:chitodextrinase